jgi:hypothetical protein
MGTVIKNVLWRRETVALASITGVLVVIFGVLSTVPNLAAPIELETASSASSLRVIYENPVNAPYKILTYIATSISPSVRMVRIVSFLYLLVTAYAMFYVLKHWHKTQTAIIVTAAFSTNSIVMATGRLGAPLITVFSWFIFSGLLLWQLHTRSNKAVPIVLLIALASLFYTPGVLWFFLIVSFVYWDRYKEFFKHVKLKALFIGGALSLIVITPLILGFIRDTETLRTWLLLPQNFVWNDIWRSALAVPSAFIYRMPEAPLLNIGRLPIFDVASGVLFLIGLNAYRRKIKLDRTRIMIGSALVGMILGALGETIIAVILLLPFAYSIIAAGIEFLLDEWHRVFPRNPIARSFGIILITVAVSFSSYYHLTRFLVVWPQTPETKMIYKEPRILD